MNRQNYKTLYYQFESIVPLAATKSQTVINYPIESDNDNEFYQKSLFSQVLKFLAENEDLPAGLNTDIFLDELYDSLKGYYLPLNPHAIMLLPTDLWKVNNNRLILSQKINLTFPSGDTFKKTQNIFISKNIFFTPPEKVYVYTGWYNFINQVCTILLRAFNRASRLAFAYQQIPVTDEHFTEESEILPNLVTKTQENFNPIGSVSPANKVITEVSQQGSQKTITKRPSGVNNREQIEIVRNLPNIFTDAINQIKHLLVFGQVLQDMFDWNLLGDSYVDNGGGDLI